MITGWSPTKIVQMVLIGCISRSPGQKLGFQNAIFKNLVWKYKAQSVHIVLYNIISRSSTSIWCITLVVLCKWLHCDRWPFPQVSDPGPFGPSCYICIRNVLFLCALLPSTLSDIIETLCKSSCMYMWSVQALIVG